MNLFTHGLTNKIKPLAFATCLGLAAFGTTMSSAHAASVFYTIIDLGTLGGTYSAGSGINSSGQIVGTTRLAGDVIHRAFRSDGTTHALTNLGTSSGNSFGLGINDSGETAGYSVVGSGSLAFRHNGTSLLTLGTLGGGRTVGADINNSGQIVGYGQISGNTATRAFRTNATTNALTSFGTLGGRNSYGAGINSSGEVTGTAETTFANTFGHAFRSNTGTAMTDLGTFGGDRSAGSGINDSGQVAGYAQTAGNAAYRAFRSDGTTNALTDLGTLGGTNSFGNGINNAGRVVGTSSTVSDGNQAFIWDSVEGMQNLNDLLGPNEALLGLVTLLNATGINDAGQITGALRITATGEIRAYQLTEISAVPVPAALPLFLSGLLGLGIMAQRRKQKTAAA